MALKHVSVVPTGLLRVNSDGILTSIRAFSNREPMPFSKAHTLGYTQSKFGNDRVHIRGESTSRKWLLSEFLRDRPGS